MELVLMFHYPAPLWHFVKLAPSINVMTYLLTYLLVFAKRCC